eukprot:4180805-Pyramimonas_sp.AAC.1
MACERAGSRALRDPSGLSPGTPFGGQPGLGNPSGLSPGTPLGGQPGMTKKVDRNHVSNASGRGQTSGKAPIEARGKGCELRPCHSRMPDGRAHPSEGQNQGGSRAESQEAA